jgi:hypothetical protein
VTSEPNTSSHKCDQVVKPQYLCYFMSITCHGTDTRCGLLISDVLQQHDGKCSSPYHWALLGISLFLSSSKGKRYSENINSPIVWSVSGAGKNGYTASKGSELIQKVTDKAAKKLCNSPVEQRGGLLLAFSYLYCCRKYS